jgi:plastocyanin
MSKKRQKKGGSGGLPRGLRRNLGWIITGGAVAIVAIVIAVLVLTSGSSSEGDGSSTLRTASPTPPYGSATPAATINVEADDEGQQVNPRFVPNQIEGPANQVLAIKLNNVGTVAHNLHVAGVDAQYDTADDFTSLTAQPGKEVELLVKIDPPGSYPFKCDFHPQQTGTLVLN